MVTARTDPPGCPVDALASRKKLRIIAENRFNRELDAALREREKLHSAALAEAAAKHASVRQQAEEVIKRIQIILDQEERQNRMDSDIAKFEQTIESNRLKEVQRQQQWRQRQREAEEAEAASLREAEKARAEKVEADQKRAERAAKEQAAKVQAAKEAAAARELAAKEAEARERLAKAEQAKREQALKEQQAKETAARAAAAAPQATAVAQAAAAVAQAPPAFQGDALHPAFLEVHQRLKHLRRDMLQLAKQTPQLKTLVGETRREIRKCVGQLVIGNTANATPTKNLKAVLRKARNEQTTPRIDVRQYIVPESMPAPINADGSAGTITADPMVSALFVYALNIFGKAVIAQLSSEASVDPKMADPVGVLVARVFCDPEFMWGGRTLIDILVAKYHVACPVLFGVYGGNIGGAPNDNNNNNAAAVPGEHTNEGRKQLGWARVEKDGPFMSEQRHSERMTGLGAGYGAIGLRNFRRSPRVKNPYPNRKYWQSLCWIVCLPREHVTTTHFTVLKAMLQGYESRFVEAFGVAAFEALQVALLNFPRDVPNKTPAANAVTVLPEVLHREHHLTVENAAFVTLSLSGLATATATATAPQMAPATSSPAPGTMPTMGMPATTAAPEMSMADGVAATGDAAMEMDDQPMQF